MTAFWTAWIHQLPAVLDTGRLKYRKPMPITLGLDQVPLILPSVVDMRAMAIHYPSVAAALAQAHLTADQWEEYGQALLTATWAEMQDSAIAASMTKPSIMAKNMIFLKTHQNDLSALRAIGMWIPTASESHDFGGDLDP
jgi:hypothetical protein